MYFSKTQVLVLLSDPHVVGLGSVTGDGVDVSVLDPTDKAAELLASVDLGSVDPGLTATIYSVVDENNIDVVCSSKLHSPPLETLVQGVCGSSEEM